MELLYGILIVAAVIALAVLVICYICYRMAFYSAGETVTEEYPLPKGDIYIPYRDQLIQWLRETRAMPCERMSIRSFDGLTLRGRYYECNPGGIVELMMPGYRGLIDRDLCGGVQRAFGLGHNVLVVNQRACGDSEGHVISFGINERIDCLYWVREIIRQFGPEVKIILAGVSMGAATVMMAGGLELPENVVGIIADCGYDSPKNIIQKVIRTDMHLPPKLAYPFVKLAARIFGGFDLEAASPLEAMKVCKVPVFFTHGEADAFVPMEMTVACYEACNARKTFFPVPDVGHGLAYIADPQGYIDTLNQFFHG